MSSFEQPETQDELLQSFSRAHREVGHKVIPTIDQFPMGSLGNEPRRIFSSAMLAVMANSLGLATHVPGESLPTTHQTDWWWRNNDMDSQFNRLLNITTIEGRRHR